MSLSMGKHILIDCYGCRISLVDNFPDLLDTIHTAMAYLDLDLYDTHVHKYDEALVVIAIGKDSHVCLHSYPNLGYVAVDVFTFRTDANPTQTMKIFRRQFRPDKIRATSIKRGKVDPNRDMKPKTKSHTTQWRRVKTTGAQIKKTRDKVLNAFRPHRSNDEE